VSPVDRQPDYRLPARRTGTALLGYTAAQLTLAGTGAGALAAGAATAGAAGTAAGLAVLVCCLGLALAQAGGQPLHRLLPVAVAFAAGGRRPRPGTPAPAGRRNPLPGTARGGGRSGGRGPAGATALPAWMPGIEITPAPDDAGAPAAGGGRPGLIRHRPGVVTVVLDVRGGPYTLLDADAQHRRIGAWARVLSQTARETPALRLGWTVRSHPGAPPPDPPARHTAPDAPAGPAPASYRRLLAQTAPTLTVHEVRLWLTVDLRRARRRGDPAHAALAAADALAGRCRAAGLTVHGLLDAAGLAETFAAHADPPQPGGHPAPAECGPVGLAPAGLAARAGLGCPAGAPAAAGLPGPAWPAGLGLRPHWDAVQIGGSWHRLFWISQWPPTGLHPGWLDPLLHEAPGVRTLAVVMQPVPPRVSRRRINSETAAVDTAVQMRERHAFRVPAHLAQAHADIDRRDAELAAGFPEYAYLGLVDAVGADRTALDDACAALADLAARCGIADLRPLHGRHHLAWPATLPFGLAPARTTTGTG
jgi:hypothetical protein